MDTRGNAAVSWVWRESGLAPKGHKPNDVVLREAAEDNLVAKGHLTERHCQVPGVPRSTFLMVFSPDGTKVASTHGNHNIYVSELSTGKHVKTLSGHPRTPWCVAFHPSHTQLLASGCLGGQVRVWDLSGGSEVWTIGQENGIASIAFHPRDQLLVIAACNELFFWDWNQPKPFTSIQTNANKAKVRFVAFDALGHKLITGISCWPYSVPTGSIVQPVPHSPPENAASHLPGISPHEQIVSSYHNLVQRYDNLVRSYHRCVLGYQPANTTDRGTDPMEVDYRPPGSGEAENRLATSQSATSSTTTNTEPSITPSVSNANYISSSDNSDTPQDQPSSQTSSRTNANQPTRRPTEKKKESEPTPGTSTQSAFQPVTESRTDRSAGTSTDRINRASISRPSTRDRLNSPNAPEQSVRVVLTAPLNRLQSFMENSIDNILNLWERYDTAYSSTVCAMNLLREFPTGSGRNDNAASASGSSSRPQSQRSREGETSNRSDSQRLDTSLEQNRDIQRFDMIHNILRDSGDRLFSLIAGMGNNQPAPTSDQANLLMDRNIRLTQCIMRALSPTTNRNNATEAMDTSTAQNEWGNTEDLETEGSNSEAELTSNRPSNDMPNNLDTPSTSNYRNSDESNNTSFSDSNTSETRANDAFERVTRGVRLIELHTEALISVRSRRQSSLRRVRNMWENLKREIICLQRSSDQENPSIYGLTTLERCRRLHQMHSERVMRGNFDERPGMSNNEEPSVDSEVSENLNAALTRAMSYINNNSNGSTQNTTERTERPESHRSRSSSTSTARRNRGRTAPSRLRSIRLQEIGHRRNVMNIRRGELELTRDRIRMHARRVLAIMFSIIMDCVETEQLNNRIMAMLRSLKKALSLTSLLLVSHLFSDVPSPDRTPSELEFNVNIRAQHNAYESADSFINRNFLTRLRHLRDEMYLQIRRSRTLLRLHPVPRMRRRIPLSSRSIHSVMSYEDSPPSTSQAPPNPSRLGNEPSTSTSESNGASRTRESSEFRGSSRSNFLRRFFMNHRIMGNMVHVYRHENSRSRRNQPENVQNEERDRQREQDEIHRALVAVPLVQVNDVPISDMPQNNENPQPQSHPRASDYFLPVINGQHVISLDDSENRWSTTFRFVTECPSAPIHRIQVWDFTNGELPDISNVNKNVVVRRCKIHNDASIDISQDGRLLVALLPAQRMGNITNLLGIFSLEWRNLGECLYTTLLEQNAVSVSLSPCARHLAVGLGSKRVSLSPIGRNGVMAVIYRLGSVKVKENDSRFGNLIPIRNLEQSWESGFTSLNCLRWAPQPGQGLVYANNTGQLKILS